MTDLILRRFESTDAFENNNEDEEAREIRRRKSEKDDDRSVSPVRMEGVLYIE